mmetsp:Transcript_14416/g.40967  ORF Transcript_14416/g.40967 Transcript_14416/m.40967 type:complete len:254 (-) Transcript_14416:46-807(-)
MYVCMIDANLYVRKCAAMDFLSQAAQGAKERDADQCQVHVSAHDGDVHETQGVVAVHAVVLDASLESNSHPQDPTDEGQDVDGDHLVVAQNVLDALDGVVGAFVVIFSRCPESGVDVRAVLDLGAGAVVNALGTGGGRQKVHPRLLTDPLHDVHRREYVHGAQHAVEEQPRREAAAIAVHAREALDPVDYSWHVEGQGGGHVREERRPDHLAEGVAAHAACLARKAQDLVDLVAEFTEGLTDNGGHDDASSSS